MGSLGHFVYTFLIKNRQMCDKSYIYVYTFMYTCTLIMTIVLVISLTYCFFSSNISIHLKFPIFFDQGHFLPL